MDDRADESSGKWVYPRDLKRNRMADEDEPAEAADPPAVLCSIPRADALQLCARLESNGIACDVVPHAAAEDAAAQQPLVDVMVAQADLPLAQECLAIAESDMKAEDEEFEQELAERNVRNFVCPKCRRRTLVPLPAATGWRVIRYCSLACVLLPPAVMIFLGVVPSHPAQDWLDSVAGVWHTAWVLSILALFWSVFAVKRHKRCPECDWRSDRKIA